MTRTYLNFEKPIQELDEKIEQFKLDFTGDEEELEKELEKFNKKMTKTITNVFSNLSPWEIVQVARHPQRPYTSDYIEMIVDDFFELHGDRNFRDDPSIIGGFGTIGDEKFVIIGHQKGRGTRQKIYRNFGMAHPEGYRKAIRLMKLGEKFNLPILTLIDTPGAYPGIGAE
ncbi:acetyl-CoA carboxylase carboxyl transferase subunit alpha, partial [Candidatus Dependentiae bacterium]|nr:acetyl-CoA carboxylase carboxyl transferase subunit alpha [Candidatus Dependentiae bacterium]